MKKRMAQAQKESAAYRKMVHAILEYEMIAPGDHVIVGVSGGPDSVCLLAALREYQKECSFAVTAVHVEHGVRGKESIDDARFVERLCESWKLPCMVETIDVKALAGRENMSVEEAGRKARYEIFEHYRLQLGADKIAVAHNQNDQAETVLLNLVRGSGLRGMGGMLPVRDHIIRPLLFVSRAEIEAWLAERNISYRTDRTNLETEYTRNKLRLQILPELERGVNREAAAHIAAAAAQLQKAERYLELQAKRLYESCVTVTEQGIEISIPQFAGEEEVLQEYVLRRCIRKLLRERGLRDYTAGHIESLLRLTGMPCGRRISLPGIEAVRQREIVLLRSVLEREAEERKESAAAECLPLAKSGAYQYLGRSFCVQYLEKLENMQSFPEKKFTKWLAYDTMKNNVCLRTRKKGDYLIINREGGKKKLKDYFIDQKIPREEREKVLLVAQESHILWVIGGRISEAAKITGTTEKLLKIQMMEDEV